MLLNAYERNSNIADAESSKSATQERGKKSKKNAAPTEETAAPAVNGNHAPAPEPSTDECDHDLKKVNSFGC